MNTPKDKPPFKSSSFDTQNDIEGLEKQTKLSGYEQSANEALKLQLKDNQDTLCSDTWISFQELEASAWQPSSLGEYRQLSLWNLTPTLNSSLNTKDSDYLSFPTLTSGQTNSKMRPAGQTKCEKWFKDKGLIPNGSQLGTKAIASLMNFPMDWFSPLSPAKPQEELEPDILQVEPSPQHKQRSLSAESSTSTQLLGGDENSPLQENKKRLSLNQELSIPCLVKQPKQSEVKGVIKQDLGDRFVVYILDSDSTVTVSKLFVYPDFSKTVGQISPTKKVAPPSKTRRKKGDGTGYIYRRTITRRGKQYEESYYRYRDELGKLRSKYIPQRLLDKVQEAESRKKPIADILVLLGGDEISRGEQFSTLDNEKVQNSDENNQSISLSRGEQITPPSIRKRKQGQGTGYIECKPIKRGGNEYKQYWYHYEEWREGDRLTKKSRYIPKRLLARVEKLERSKAPVRAILEVLGMKE
jgi:hypothetical protein